MKKELLRLLILLCVLFVFIGIYFFDSSPKETTLSIPNISKSIENNELYQKKLELYEQNKLSLEKEIDSHFFCSPTSILEKQKASEEKHQKEQRIKDLEQQLQKQQTNKSISFSKEVIHQLIPKKEKSIKTIIPKIKPKTQKEIKQEQRNKLQKLYEDFEKRQAPSFTKEKLDLLAEITTNQTIISGKEIEFRLLEDLPLEKLFIPKGSIIYGIAHFDTHRIKVEFSHIQLKGTLLPFHRTLYDLDGFEGIALSSNTLLKEMEDHLSDEALDTGNSMELSHSNLTQKGVKIATNLIKKISSQKKKQLTVELDAGHKVILRDLELVNAQKKENS